MVDNDTFALVCIYDELHLDAIQSYSTLASSVANFMDPWL